MKVLDNIFNDVNAIFSEWIKIEDPKSKWTIADFPEEKGVDENVTNPHCWRCVSVNQCLFKNEDNKKPEEFDYSKYSPREISYYIRGLYHPNCHDKKFGANVPRVEKIVILGVRKKFDNFFSKKRKIFSGIGYSNKDEYDIINLYLKQVQREYVYGNYYKYRHTKFGFQINMTISINIKKIPKEFKNFRTGLIVYPNGQLRIVTVFAGRE